MNSPLLVRKIQNSEGNIFLTFDDGPELPTTRDILVCLNQHQTLATFFVIGQKAKQNRELIQTLQMHGHQLFSHSTDHHYGKFFGSKKQLKAWVLESIDELQQLTGKKHWGFRPPAGVVTPPLIEIAEEEQLPIYLWNHRFYDSRLIWTKSKAEKSATQMASGDIILLHDRQKQNRITDFTQTLDFYLLRLKAKGYKPSIIP